MPEKLVHISDYAFDRTALKQVTIPSSVTSIGERAFDRNVVLRVAAGSHAETYAQSAHNAFELTDETVRNESTEKPANGDTQKPVRNAVAPQIDSASAWAQEQLSQAHNLGLIPESLQSPYIKDTISGWALEQVGRIQGAGVMSGVGDNLFALLNAYTREQSIITVLQLYSMLK